MVVLATSEARTCRFCLGSDADEDCDNDFVQPCPCRGSSQFVHMSCLVKHFTTRCDWGNFKCPTCNNSYQGKALRTLAEISQKVSAEQYGPHALEVAHSMSCLAQANRQLGNFSESKHLLESCLAIKEKHVGAGHISTAATLNNLASAHRELGDIEQERALVEKSLAIKQRHFGKGHAQTAAALVNLAGVHSDLGETSKCCDLLRESLAIEEKCYGAQRLESALALNNLAIACGELGDFMRMRQLLEQSLYIKQRHHGTQHSETSLSLVNLSMANGILGNEDVAKEQSRLALVAAGGQSTTNARRHSTVLLRAAVVHYGFDEVAIAETLATQALHRLGRSLSSDACARVSDLEKARLSRMWTAAGRDDIVRWVKMTLRVP